MNYLFHKIYIYLTGVRERLIGGCRRIIGVDGCFLKGFSKGWLLVAVGIGTERDNGIMDLVL